MTGSRQGSRRKWLIKATDTYSGTWVRVAAEKSERTRCEMSCKKLQGDCVNSRVNICSESKLEGKMNTG